MWVLLLTGSMYAPANVDSHTLAGQVLPWKADPEAAVDVGPGLDRFGVFVRSHFESQSSPNQHSLCAARCGRCGRLQWRARCPESSSGEANLQVSSVINSRRQQ